MQLHLRELKQHVNKLKLHVHVHELKHVHKLKHVMSQFDNAKHKCTKVENPHYVATACREKWTCFHTVSLGALISFESSVFT